MEEQSQKFGSAHRRLKRAVDRLFALAEKKLAGPAGSDRRSQALNSLLRHRDGLYVFVDRPDVPMDSNLSERMHRGPVPENGGPQTAAQIGPVFDDPAINAVALANHGTIRAGKTLMAALFLAEIIEETAQVAVVCDTLMLALRREKPETPRYGTHVDERHVLERT